MLFPQDSILCVSKPILLTKQLIIDNNYNQ